MGGKRGTPVIGKESSGFSFPRPGRDFIDKGKVLEKGGDSYGRIVGEI